MQYYLFRILQQPIKVNGPRLVGLVNLLILTLWTVSQLVKYEVWNKKGFTKLNQLTSLHVNIHFNRGKDKFVLGA